MRLTNYKIQHDAWRSLKGNSIKVYLELHSRFNGKNNGDLHLKRVGKNAT